MRKSRFVIATLIMAMALAVPAVASGGDRKSGQASRTWRNAPIVIAHRGASGHRPEHTLAAYELAIEMGADFIEPDLVSTSDGVLVARHENEISTTTDVAEHSEFADRQTTKMIDGIPFTGWFTEDFTLAELKTLRARERLPSLRPDNTAFDGLYEIPTLQEVIDLAQSAGVGIYPETKHPSYFDSIGLSLEEPLVETLHDNGYRKRRAPVFIQSFETANLRELNEMTELRLVQLLNNIGQPYDFVLAGDPRTYTDLATPQGLREIATYADGIGPNKTLIVPLDAQGNLQDPTSLVDDAHAAGLVVHPWTFRNENMFLPADFRAGDPQAATYLMATGDAPAEYRLYFDLGVDGLFSDYPDTAVATRTAWLRAPRPR
jgi:glycerophosphoryl diester phosphodiesterase